MRRCLGVVALLAAWQWSSRTGHLDPRFASSPARIVGALWDLVSTSSFWTVQLSATAKGFLAGWSAAVLVGIAAGLLMALCRPIREAFDPILTALYLTPHIALVPLLIVWFGLGLEYELVVVFLASVFSVLLNTIGAVSGADERLAQMSRSFGARRWQVLSTVVLPGARSAILVGVRQSVAHGIVGAVIGEMFSSRAGIGYLISQSAHLGLTDRLFALVTLLAVTGTGLDAAISALQSRLERWRAAAPMDGGRA
jgi:NitT/TauT family transport system permease protein